MPIAAAEKPVNIELLLALDSSASMDRKEFNLQIMGLAEAFRDPMVLKAIDNLKPLGAAIAIAQWGGAGEMRLLVPFKLVRTEREARDFAFRASRGTRLFYASTTSITTAIGNGVDMLKSNGFDGQRLVIDVSGDGEDNSGLDLASARKTAQSAGVVVNGLAIESDVGTLTSYYHENVITGADSFVITARDFQDYARAIRDKLLRELRPLGS